MKEFIRITNKEVYCKILDIEKKLDRQNRKVNIAVWASSTALTLSIIMVGVLLRK